MSGSALIATESILQQICAAITLEEATTVTRIAMPAHIEIMLGLSIGGLDTSMPLIELGIDSLIAVELRLWVFKELDHDLRGRIILVNGDATTTEIILMQVMSQIGCLPIATCSPRNAAMVAKYGARKVFDYALPTCAKDIEGYSKDRLDCLLDCIGSIRS